MFDYESKYPEGGIEKEIDRRIDRMFLGVDGNEILISIDDLRAYMHGGKPPELSQEEVDRILLGE